MKIFKKNCCDGIYNSIDVHFTSACDNKCAHCIDMKYEGLGIKKPDIIAISKTIVKNKDGFDDVLFLGGEPCLYLEELIDCIKIIKGRTDLKIFVTTSVPKICYDKYKLFCELLEIVDGINLSVQHHKEEVADEIRKTKSQYNRQEFYNSLPYKEKIRINLNIVKPYLYTKEDITDCLNHYDKMGFNSIKISEIQHGKDYFISFEDTFNIKLGSPFYSGCQTYLDMDKIIPNFKTPVLLKRSCFMCEETLKASFLDGIKVLYKKLTNGKSDNNYGVVYENGFLNKGWR
jgi:pyruvate-formate lyase-activating enzyme